MSAFDPIAWRIYPDRQLQFRSWANEFVVYDDCSGDTHMLSPVGAMTLICLQQGPATVMELAGRVASSLEMNVDNEFIQAIELILTDFNRLELVERIRH